MDAAARSPAAIGRAIQIQAQQAASAGLDA
jgi:hypothetical protein